MQSNDLTVRDLSTHYKAIRARLMRGKTSNVVYLKPQETHPEPTSAEIEAIEPKRTIRKAAMVARTARRERLERDRAAVKHIIRECAIHFGYSITEFMSHRQTQPIAHHRQIAMYLSRELTTASLPMIGDAFDFRDHTTIMHACRTIEGRAASDQNLSTLLPLLTAKIQNGDV
jgi:chromosomal replication initiation ATPase DnaA